MSYILEALKKAQAERQLGELPTIHAPQLQAGAASHAGALRKPLWLVLGASALLALGGSAALLWRTAPSATIAPQAGTATPVALAPAPVSAAPPAKPVVPAAPPPVPAAAVAAVSAATPPAASVAPLAPLAPAAPVAPVAPAAAPAEPPAPAVSDEAVLNLRDLPEPIQKQIPPLALGGYMYSKNPADRLLLIDKVLRHEGEEVAPGVVLEKLLPKAAQFTFKGYRYRIPY